MNILPTLKQRKKHIAAGIFWIAVLCIGGYSYVTDYLPRHQQEQMLSSQLASVLASVHQPFELAARAQETGCDIQGALPDPECSPGAIFPEATLKEICVSGYTKTVRKVSVSLKKKVFAEYAIAYPVPFGSYEVDHIIPLAIGGSNDIANLYPESAEPYPGFKEKDVVENFLHDAVCEGRIELRVAQVQIARDWTAVYNSLSPAVIEGYKKKYPSWADRDIDD